MSYLQVAPNATQSISFEIELQGSFMIVNRVTVPIRKRCCVTPARFALIALTPALIEASFHKSFGMATRTFRHVSVLLHICEYCQSPLLLGIDNPKFSSYNGSAPTEIPPNKILMAVCPSVSGSAPAILMLFDPKVEVICGDS
jgi:hypothetical protein